MASAEAASPEWPGDWWQELLADVVSDDEELGSLDESRPDILCLGCLAVLVIVE